MINIVLACKHNIRTMHCIISRNNLILLYVYIYWITLIYIASQNAGKQLGIMLFNIPLLPVLAMQYRLFYRHKFDGVLFSFEAFERTGFDCIYLNALMRATL